MEISQLNYSENHSKLNHYEKNLSQLGNLAKAEYNLQTMGKEEIEKLKEVTQGIEQIFIKMLTDQMRKNTHKHLQNDSASQNQSREIFEEMLYDEYGKSISKNNSLGISKLLFDQLTTPVIHPKDLERLYQ